MDTSLSGNHNTGHEYRDMTLEELESANVIAPDVQKAQETRWAEALGMRPDELARATKDDRVSRVRRASRDARKLPHYVPARGVLGVEFTDEERWQIVEYLKTI